MYAHHCLRNDAGTCSPRHSLHLPMLDRYVCVAGFKPDTAERPMSKSVHLISAWKILKWWILFRKNMTTFFLFFEKECVSLYFSNSSSSFNKYYIWSNSFWMSGTVLSNEVQLWTIQMRPPLLSGAPLLHHEHCTLENWRGACKLAITARVPQQHSVALKTLY